MTLNINASLIYTSSEPGTIIFNIQTRTPAIFESFSTDPALAWSEVQGFPEPGRLLRLQVDRALHFSCAYQAEAETVFSMVDCSYAPAVNVDYLPTNVLHYLYPSRYCQSDRLVRLATREFDHYENEFEKVLAVCDWIFSNVEYLSGTTDSETSAYDTVTQRVGVCRDFAHLGIAICRALNIPARYCAAYAYQLQPQDFHACFEAYIGSSWIIFDPTRLAPLNGLVKIAVGRDAADTAVASIFGNIQGDEMRVDVSADPTGFVPFFYQAGQLMGAEIS